MNRKSPEEVRAAVSPKKPAKDFIFFKNVTKKFDTGNNHFVYAFSDVSFKVAKSEIVAFVGPSGCGKTTVLRILSGLETDFDGEAKIYDKPVKIGTCGMVFQSYSSFPWLTVLENVTFGLKIQKIGKDQKERENRARKYIEEVGLKGFEDRYPKELSGGQKQRVAIARSLAVENRILLMDEPFGALDIKIRQEMQELLLKIWKDLGMTILFVTHDIQEAIYLSNRILVFTRSRHQKGGTLSRTQICVNKPLEERTPEWKKSEDFQKYEQQLKQLQFN